MTTGTDGGAGGAATETFDYAKFSEGLDEATRTGITKHYETQTAGLKSALDSEREQSKNHEKALKAALAKAEKGSEMETQLNAALTEIQDSKKYIAYLEGASSQGIVNPAAAWTLLKADGLFRADGSPDFELLKKNHPYMFTEKKPADSKGGAGAEGDQKTGLTMNEIIRQAAGR